MKIPVFQNDKFTQDNGNLTNEQQMWFDNLIQQFQNGLSDQGWTTPQQDTTEINKLATTMPVGTIWYDSVTNKLKVLTNAGVETISSS